MVDTNFWGIWNRLPFEKEDSFTGSWLRQEDEQLPDRQLFWESLRRFMLLYVQGENSSYRSSLPQNAQKILWIHKTDHVGDSLIRLSLVQLLLDRTVDQLADNTATWLFEPGGYFRDVMSLSDDDVRLDTREYPVFRYTPSDRYRALRSEQDVNTIEPEAVVREFELALAGHWQVWED